MKKYQLSGFEVTEYDELESTNTTAAGLSGAEIRDKSVVVTYRQTQGRGQIGNKWECDPFRNISMTVIFRPDGLEAGGQFAVSMVITLGCKDFIDKYVDGCTIKWPNDVYVGEKKMVGILIEHFITGAYVGHSLCGIGVNINQKEFVSDAPNPVSLFQLTGEELDLHTALEELLACIGRRYGQIGDYKRLEADFLNDLYRKNGVFEWRDEQGKFRGEITGVDEYGQLIIKDTEGIQRVYAFKEVAFVR